MVTALTQLPPFASTNIDAHGYDSGTRTLAVRFKSGKLYHYRDVEPEVAQDFAEASSMGGFLAQTIKPNYAAELQDEEVEGD